jgi:putative phosphoesterase
MTGFEPATPCVQSRCSTTELHPHVQSRDSGGTGQDPRIVCPMRLLVLSDTHIPDFAKRLPPGLYTELRQADLVLHAGDVTSPSVLDELATFAPVHVALGNVDGPAVAAWGATPEVRLELDGIGVAMVHDSGPRPGRERRLSRRFPGARLIVFGHSHIPIDDDYEGVRLLNPGSPTWKRRQPAPTYGVVHISRGRIRCRLVALPACRGNRAPP